VEDIVEKKIRKHRKIV